MVGGHAQERDAGATRRPLVAIVIVNFNYARYLDSSVESALRQTYPAVEVIVVDDASTDESADVIRRYGTAVTAVLRPANGGHAAAFNSGFAVSRGDVVIFLDADDYLYPDAVERVIARWPRGAAKVQYRLDLVDDRGAIVDTYPAPEVPFDSGDVVPLLLATGRYQTAVTSGNAFHRTVLERIMPVPEADFRQGADGYLVAMAPFHGAVASLETSLGAYRQHGANHSAFGARLAERARWRLAHDDHRYAAIRRAATARGLAAAPDPGLRDPLHIEERLASLSLDPGHHPVPNDRRFRLALAGMRAVRHTRLGMRRRAVLVAWFLAVGALPVRLARPVLTWKLQASSRPLALKRIAWLLRRATR